MRYVDLHEVRHHRGWFRRLAAVRDSHRGFVASRVTLEDAGMDANVIRVADIRQQTTHLGGCAAAGNDVKPERGAAVVRFCTSRNVKHHREHRRQQRSSSGRMCAGKNPKAETRSGPAYGWLLARATSLLDRAETQRSFT